VKPELVAQIPIAGIVQYRPLSFIKIITDKKVYAVAKGGVLHWVQSESVMNQVAQPNWRAAVKDVPDAFFVNYTIGASIDSTQAWSTQMVPSSGQMTIDDALGL
jgi:hypothetical protein